MAASPRDQVRREVPGESEVQLHLSTVRRILEEDVRRVLREELADALRLGAGGAGHATPTHNGQEKGRHSVTAGPTVSTGTVSPASRTFNPKNSREWLDQSAEASLESDVPVLCQGEPRSPRCDTPPPDTPPPDQNLSWPPPDENLGGMSRHLNDRVGHSFQRQYTENLEGVRSRWDVLADRAPGLGPCLQSLRAAFQGFGISEAPQRSDPLSKFADGLPFLMIVDVTILLNCVFMVASADYEMSHRYDDDQSEFFVYGEVYFLLVYLFELAVKIWRYRLHFFYDTDWKYNWLDFSLVCASIYSIILEDQLPNFSWLRMLRILRLAKLLRVFQLIAIVKPLRAILRSIVNTMGTLAWSIIMLMIILFMFALMLVLRLASYFKEGGSFDDPMVEDKIMKIYGNVGLTMLHLFMVTTGGKEWSVYYKPLEETGEINCMIFILFIAFTHIAVMNIILGIFVDDAMKHMIAERDERLQEHEQEHLQMAKNLRELFGEMDVDGNSKLSRDEWHRAFSKRKFQVHLDMMGFRSSEVIEFLDLMHDNSEEGTFDIDTFVRSCMRFRGPASCFDMQLLLNEVKQNKDLIRSLQGAEE
jgi:hypothetical protein